MTAPAVTHEFELVPLSATRWKSKCSCGEYESTGYDNPTFPKDSWRSHVRSATRASARTEPRAAARREQNRRVVNQVSNARNEGGLSRTEWSALDRNTRKQLTAAAQAAQVRVDDGEARPGDDVLAEVFDRHTQWDAFVWPEPLCVHGNTKDCNPCYLDHDQAVERSADV